MINMIRKLIEACDGFISAFATLGRIADKSCALVEVEVDSAIAEAQAESAATKRKAR